MTRVDQPCHDSPYRSVPMYRSTIGMVRIDILTHGIMGHTDRLIYTAYTGPLLDRYIQPIPSSIPRYDEPWIKQREIIEKQSFFCSSALSSSILFSLFSFFLSTFSFLSFTRLSLSLFIGCNSWVLTSSTETLWFYLKSSDLHPGLVSYPAILTKSPSLNR